MRATASQVEGNRVRLSVEIDETEVDQAVRQTARRLAGELRVPGFRPGKVPRKVLEARLGGSAVLREQAIRDVLPDMYMQAVADTEVDPIAPPDIDIVGGQQDGAVSFDAVVEVRPTVAIPGYGGLVVALPSIVVSEEDVDAQVDRLREQFGELVPIDRPAVDGDYVTIDLRAQRSGEEDLHVEDFLYEIGSGSAVPGLDEEIRGSVAGDIFEFDAKVPTGDGTELDSRVKVLVKSAKQKKLPEATDTWAKEASEFETIEELRGDLRSQLERVKLAQAQLALQERSMEALEGLVVDPPPEPLVAAEVEERLHDLTHRLADRKLSLEQFLLASGQDAESLVAGLRAGAERSVLADLALRALADAEDLQVTDDELDQYVSNMAEQLGLSPKQVRDRIDRSGRWPAIRSEQRKAKAVAWLLDHVELVDESGEPIDRTMLKIGSDDEVGGGASPPSADDGDEVDGVDKEGDEMGTAK